MKINFLTYFKRLDAFGSGVNFTFNGDSSYRSVCGAILTIIMFTLTLFQLQEKSLVLINKDDTKHSRRVEFGGNNVVDNSIGYKETGYNFAFNVVPLDFAIVGYESQIDPEIFSYLNIQVYESKFKLKQDGNIVNDFNIIPIR